MKKQPHQHSRQTAGEKAEPELKADTLEKDGRALVDGNHGDDQQQGGKDLESSNHARQYAAIQGSGIAVSIGRQVAALSRYRRLPADRERTAMQMNALLASLLMRAPTTAADALVMATIARNLSAAVVATLPEMAEDDHDMPLRVSFALLSHAVTALETVTGLSSASFTGSGPALN